MSRQAWKFVSVWNCIKIIIFALIALAIVFIPVKVNGVSVSTYKILPVIGDGTFFSTFITDNLINSIFTLIPSLNTISNLSEFYKLATYAFFIIIALDVVFALLLILTRSRILRFIIRIFSIVFSLVTLLIGLMYLLYVVAILYGCILNGTIDKIVDMGILIALGFNVASLFLSKKQSKWFKKPFPPACYKNKE